MSSLSQAYSIALTGITTTSELINLASNNIANASTPGYTDKTGNLTARDPSAGGGVTLSSYSRVSDQALTGNYNSSTSDASYYSTLNTYMTTTQTILNSTSSNPTLSNDISNYSAAWSNFSASPEDPSQQSNLINTGKKLTNDIQTINSQISALDTQVQSDTKISVTSMNTILKQIAQLNIQIQNAQTSGQDTTNLQDQMDDAVNSLSNYVSVKTESRANGQIALYTNDGQLLVDSGVAQQFTYDGTNVKNQFGTTVNGSLTGGSLQAQLDFRDSSQANSSASGVGTIAKLKAQLSTIVSAFVGVSGSASSTNPTQQVTYNGSLPNAASVGYTSAATTTTVADASGGTHTLSYSWTKTGASSWSLNVNSPDATYTATIPYTFNPATGSLTSIGSGSGYNVSNPTTAGAAANVTVSMTFAGQSSAQSIDLNFGTYGSTGSNTLLLSGSGTTSSVTNFISNGVSKFASAYYNSMQASTASGATQNGATVAASFFTVAYNTDGTPDVSTFGVNSGLQNGSSLLPQTNTTAIANTFSQTATYSTSGLSASNVTYAQLASQVLSGFQQSANAISTSNVTFSSTQSYYKTALSNKTGVNTDTELADLQTYQTSYAACAKIISAVNSMMTTLLAAF